MLLILPLLAGCEAAALATAGSVAGLAVTAISTGSDVYQLGKLDSVEMVRPRELIDATHLAASDLGLRIKDEKLIDKDRWSMMLVDDRKKEVEVQIDRRSATMTRTRVDVGLRGSEPTARLIMHRIRQHLPMWPPARPLATTQPTPALQTAPDDVDMGPSDRHKQ